MESLPPDYWVTSLQFTPHTYQDVYPSIEPTRPELSLAGKVAIVTGASRGLGAKALAPAFVKAGVKAIVLVATNADKLRAVENDLKKINPSLEALAVAADITDKASVVSLFEQVKAKFGHADILISNAGIIGGPGLIADADADGWWSNFEVNTKGTFLLVQGLLKSLPTPDTPAFILNLTTSGAWKVLPAVTGYAISKLATIKLMSDVAAIYPNVTTVSMHPGLLETDMLLDAFRKFNLDTPELVGGTAVWLASEQAKFLSGKTIAANWSVDDLVARKEEIVKDGLLNIDLTGKFGKEQFE